MTVKRRDSVAITGSQVVWSHPRPCSSSSAGPRPTLTNARRWPWMVRYWTSIGFGMGLLTHCDVTLARDALSSWAFAGFYPVSTKAKLEHGDRRLGSCHA